MERRAGVLCGLVIAVAVAACGSAAPSVPPGAAASSEAPIAADPTLVPGAVTARPLAAGALELKAFNIEFEPTTLVAPTGPFVLTFRNRDNAVPHTVAINDAAGGNVFTGEIVMGPADIDYSIPELSPGPYKFMCTVHPNMTGMLTIVP